MVCSRYLLNNLWFFLVLVLPFSASGQQYTWKAGFSTFKGFILEHNEDMQGLANTHPQGVELVISKQTYGYQDWESFLNYPEVGLGMGWIDYRFPEVLGKSVAIAPFMKFRVFSGKHSSLRFRLGTGIGIHSQPFNLEANRANNALSSSLSFNMHGKLGYYMQAGKYWLAGLETGIWHFSNGSWTQPNSGINVIYGSLNLARKIGRLDVDFQPEKSTKLKENAFYLFFQANGGLNMSRDLAGKNIRERFLYTSYNVSANWQLSRISSVTVGADAFFSNTIKREIRERFEYGQEDKLYDHRRAGVFAGHEFYANRLSLVTQIGVYVYQPYSHLQRRLYQRYGLRYLLTDALCLSLQLKTHGGVAEVVEWGIGFKL